MLGQFERDILTQADGRERKAPVPGGYPTVAFIVWEDSHGKTQMGRVRWGYPATNTSEARWSASPFPGAWTFVPESAIRVVRHPEAMN